MGRRLSRRKKKWLKRQPSKSKLPSRQPKETWRTRYWYYRYSYLLPEDVM